MSFLSHVDPDIYQAIEDENKRQKETINLIASENYASKAVLEAQGTALTNKYAEGYPGKRYYGGCHNMDTIEEIAVERAKELFGAEHANVQPHSGAQANMAVYLAALKPGDTILGMDLSHGGHLTHGAKFNFSGRYFNSVMYQLNRETELIDYDSVEKLALEHKPQMIVVGASAYPRIIDFKRFREIADKAGALLMADIAHIAGLVAAGMHPSPVPYCDFVTSTTHKTLRGPRGGFILCKAEWASKIDAAVFPRMQGGPLMHVIAAKAVAFREAMKPEFAEYAQSVLDNASSMATVLQDKGLRIVSGGTDNHLILIDLTETGVNGKDAEDALGRTGIVINRNTVPFAVNQKANIANGIRLGSAAATSRGMGVLEMIEIAELIYKVISNFGNAEVEKEVAEKVKEITEKFPVPGIDA